MEKIKWFALNVQQVVKRKQINVLALILTKVQAVVHNFELFDLTDIDFFSRRLMETIELRKTLQDAGIKGAMKRWHGNEPGKQIKIKL